MKGKFAIIIFVSMALAAALNAFLQWRAHVSEIELQSRLVSQSKCLAAESNRKALLLETLRHKQTGLNDEKSALLHLRSDVSTLRKESTDLNALTEALEKLKEEAAAATNSQPRDVSPDPSKVRAYWSKDEITFAGHADQMSAIQSCLWALSRGEDNAIIAAMAPDSRMYVWRDTLPITSDGDVDGTSPHALAIRKSKLQHLAEGLTPATGFYVVSDNIISQMPNMRDIYSPDENAVYKIYFAGEGATRGIALKKSENEWKLTAIYALGGTEEHPTCEMNLWP